MDKNNIKLDLLLLNKKQVDLLEELRKRGYRRLYVQQLSSYINGSVCGPQSEAVMALSRTIIEEWKSERRIAQ